MCFFCITIFLDFLEDGCGVRSDSSSQYIGIIIENKKRTQNHGVPASWPDTCLKEGESRPNAARPCDEREEETKKINQNSNATVETFQHTLRRPTYCTGVGLHSGKKVRMALYPAPENSGITFVRSDLPNHPEIPARYDLVGDTTLATTLGEGRARVSTVEHLMGALSGLGIDNACITVDSPEIPIMDGSARPFVEALRQAGRRRQNAPRRYLRITKALEYAEDGRSMRIEPADSFRVTCGINFDAELIRRQRYSSDVTRRGFIAGIAGARTFGYVEEVEKLWQMGLALGGSLDCVIAIHWDRRSVLNEDGLRYKDEFVRHKMLDIIGDMGLAGAPILGHLVAERSGHKMHHEFLKQLFGRPDCWEYVSGDELEACSGSATRRAA